MKSDSLLVLVGLLVFMNLVAGDGVNGASKEKWGVCPPDNVRCFREDPPQCHKDSDCEGMKKCCFYHCGFKCVKPVEKLDGGLFPSS